MLRRLRPHEVRRLFDRILLGQRPDLGLEYLRAAGVLGALLPEVEAVVDFGGDGHKPLWPHTLQVVRQATASTIVRWAALFHDIGKIATFSRTAGKITFRGHEVESALLFKDIAARTRLFTKREIHQISSVIANLGRVEAYDSSWTERAVRRIDRDLGPLLPLVIELARADISTKHDEIRRRHHAGLRELCSRVEGLRRQARPRPFRRDRAPRHRFGERHRLPSKHVAHCADSRPHHRSRAVVAV